jgi:hypothetical protein
MLSYRTRATKSQFQQLGGAQRHLESVASLLQSAGASGGFEENPKRGYS